MMQVKCNGNLATITMSRPPVNAINAEFIAAFHKALDEVEKVEEAVALVIESDQKCFSAGADLAAIGGFFESDDGVEEMVRFVTAFHELYDRLEAFPAVTIASIHGPALGGGYELALACDLRIAAQSAKIGLPEAGIGQIPGAGGTQRLPRLCGPGVAARVILGCEVMSGGEAQKLGMVQWAVDDATLAGRTELLAAQISELGRPAVLYAKRCLAASLDPDIDGFALEMAAPLELMKTHEAKERVLRFLNKRK